MKKLLFLGLFLIFIIGCGNSQNDLTESIVIEIEEKKELVEEETYIEKITIPCNGPGGKFFFLTSKNAFEIKDRINCGVEVDVLKRECETNLGSFEGDVYEIDEVRYGSSRGWVPRSYLTKCTDFSCDYAVDSICR